MRVWARPAAPASRRERGLRRGASIAAARLLRWHELARQRRALLTLDDRMLKDIGVTRADAEREAARPFWSEALDPSPDRRRRPDDGTLEAAIRQS